MKTVAAVLVETAQPLQLAELEIPRLKPGQVLVEVAFSGVCHTQILEWRGYRGADPYLPHCLGHEGSGVVVETGSEVAKVKRGDRVILSWIKGAGADVPGSVYEWAGRKVNAGAITTFARHSVISENRLTLVPAELELRAAALLGCAVPTGAGAVFNSAAPKPGQSLAVFGIGGVGMSALLAARVAGCVPLIAIDIDDDKLLLARRSGATHTINSAQHDCLDELARWCPGGLDFALEATGRPQVMALALAAVRSQGGTAVVIGNARHGEMLQLDPRQLNQGKRLLGTWGGDNLPERDYPRYCRLVAAGRFDLSPLLGQGYRLRDVNLALESLERGRELRPLLDMSLADS